MIYSGLGEKQMAKKYLKAALESGSDFPGKDVAEKMVRKDEGGRMKDEG